LKWTPYKTIRKQKEKIRMANEMQIFKNDEFGQVRIVEINNEPYFVGKDVAEALGYAKPENAISNHVDDEDKTTTLIQGTGSNYR
jgi:prophage antirepressor-like protein